MVMITVEIGVRSVSTSRDAESTSAGTVGRIMKLTSNNLDSNTGNNMGNKTLARFSPTSIFTRRGGGRGSGKGSLKFSFSFDAQLSSWLQDTGPLLYYQPPSH